MLHAVPDARGQVHTPQSNTAAGATIGDLAHYDAIFAPASSRPQSNEGTDGTSPAEGTHATEGGPALSGTRSGIRDREGPLKLKGAISLGRSRASLPAPHSAGSTGSDSPLGILASKPRSSEPQPLYVTLKVGDNVSG